MKWVVLFFIIIFLFQGYLFADYNTDIWRFIYSEWDKIKDFLMALLIIILLRRLFESRQLISAWKVVAFFLACRIVWDCIVIIFGKDINDPIAIRWLFYICWAIVAYIFFYPFAKKMLYKVGVWLDVIIMMIFKHKT